ncbi:MAG: LEA type 2 family protein [Phycisphaerales bacterium JB040]
MNTRPLLLALLTLAPLAGCRSVKAPTFDALSAQTVRATQHAVSLEFTITADNPNPDPLPLRRVDYALEVEGRTVFSARRSPEATVPPYSSQSFTLPAVVPVELQPDDPTAPYTLTGSVRYLEPGRLNEILYDRNLRVPKAPLRIGGTITFSPIPGEAVPGEEIPGDADPGQAVPGDTGAG